MHTQFIILESEGVVLQPGTASFQPGAISGLYSLACEQGFRIYLVHSERLTPSLQKILQDEGIRFDIIHTEALATLLTNHREYPAVKKLSGTGGWLR